MSLADLISLAEVEALAYLANAMSSPRQIVAHAAAAVGAVLAIACALVRTIVPLRWLAVGSSAGLAVYGALHPTFTTFMVMATLLPINIYRAVEVTRLTRRVLRAEASADLAAVWLKPYMRTRRFRAGRTLFRKGDRADRLFMLVEGELELVDIGKRIQPGVIFGEIALFSPGGKRSHTVRCVTSCTVLHIDKSLVKQLYFQSPAFGFHLIELLATRLASDVERAESRQADG